MVKPGAMRSAAAGRFIVEAELGRGGMASVYRVRDAKSGERFALKRAASRDPRHATSRRALLEREFHTLEQLRHPRIIEVYDFGVDEAGAYYTMELLDGADLERGGRVEWLEACSLLRDIASSLAILHSRGLLHRDVSGRNVRRTVDGRAKLIDFGAMVSMGIASDVIGTPPFMAPEVLQMQALDARADLFSLGVLGYSLLTGRRPYPARTAQELRDAWRSRPALPTKLFPEIPAALSALVMQLIALDRGARPQTAAEVMERLCAIAALPKEELPEIVRGYLTTPTLVGRRDTLLAIRRRILSVVRGEGGALVFAGPAGYGRSRILDACVFEAKLLGATVARANADNMYEPWAVARSIASQLFTLLPEAALEATRVSRNVLAHVIDELRPENVDDVSQIAPERGVLLRELREFVLTLAGKHRLLLAIDDADRIDEPSMAWLSALTAKASRSNLLVACVIDSDRENNSVAALDVLSARAEKIQLSPLDAQDTEALMRSVFGDVPHLSLLAAQIHGLAIGSPRIAMELAQHMVDRGWARYEVGSWLLPERLDPSDLPATLSDSLTRRLDGLDPDSRELAEALCITEGTDFTFDRYLALTQHRSAERLNLAFEALVCARVLLASARNYRFSQRGFLDLLRANMAPERSRALHGRLADVLERTGVTPVRRAYHLMEAGRADEAVRLLGSADLMAELPTLPLLERAVAYVEHTNTLPARAVHRMRMALISKASWQLASDSFRRCLPFVLAQLEHDSGLALYRELKDVPESERLGQALGRQQQRYLDTPEDEQVFSVGDAVRELARLVGASCTIAGTVFDVELLDQLPDLAPLSPLSPAIGVVMQLRAATRQWLCGQSDRAVQTYRAMLERIVAPDRAGMDEAMSTRSQLMLQYVIGLYEAIHGNARAEELALYLESRREMRVNAWAMRSMFQLARGDADNALKSARRSELLMLQDSSETYNAGSGVSVQIIAHFLAGDLLGVKRMVDAFQRHSARHPGWVPMLIYGQSCYRLLSGDHEGALAHVQAGLGQCAYGAHLAWGHLAAQHVKVLRELGQVERSVECALRYVEQAQRGEVTGCERFIAMEAAYSLSAAQRYDEALALLEPEINKAEAHESRGLALGVFYEARAAIALAMRDKPSFERYAERCAQEYELGHNPALSAKFAQLMDAARQAGFAAAVVPDFERSLRGASIPPPAEEDNTVVSRILECVDASDRARCALTMLLQSTDCHLGHLYGVSDDRLSALAGLPTVAAEPDIERWLTEWFIAQVIDKAADEVATVTAGPDDLSEDDRTHTIDDAESGGIPLEYKDAEGHDYYPVLLVDEDSRERSVAAVLVLQAVERRRRRPPLQLLQNVANQLIVHKDITGHPLVDKTEPIDLKTAG